jgi:cytidylate kinase
MTPREARTVVTIDGPAGAGKTSVARALAERLGFTLLDSGALYRAVALVALEQDVALEDDAALEAIASDLPIRFDSAAGVQRCWLDDRDVTTAIREPRVGDAASRVSARPAVRAALLGLQRRVAEGGGVVAEGRDMGTVVFPDAVAKFFLTASPEERARRRSEQLRQAGLAAVSAGDVQREQEVRDRRDSQREAAPLRAAEDAVVVDTTAVAEDEVVSRIERAARAALVAAELARATGATEARRT